MLPTCNMQVELAPTQGAGAGGAGVRAEVPAAAGQIGEPAIDRARGPNTAAAVPVYGFLTPLLDVLAQPVEAFLEATLLEDRAPVGSGVGLGFGLGFGSGLGPGLAWGGGWGQGWGEG